MGKAARKAYLEQIRARYLKAKKAEKAKILDEFCQVCGYNRKYAIRLLMKSPAIPCKRPGPKPIYQTEVFLSALKRIWFAADQVCSKRLKALIPEWLPHYEVVYGSLPKEVQVQLIQIGTATIDRLLKNTRAKYTLKGLCTTKPGSLLKTQIPIATDQWDSKQPGFLEADTVAHCGTSIAGNFVWSLTMTDIYSGWTENRATWNKGADGVMTQIEDIEANLPFKILGFDCDNGSEFLNHHLHRYFVSREQQPVQFTRSRPYKKNDNAHVEQKNWTHVRSLFGYHRFENPKLVDLMNDLYKKEWSAYQNHFCPSMKLVEKVRIKSKQIKKHDMPKTPYQRLLESPHLTDNQKEALREAHIKLNPFILKQQIEAKLRVIFNLVSVTSNTRQRTPT